MFTLYTARYQAVKANMGVPVRTSLGAPRWKLAYELRHNVREVTPERSFLRAPRDVFTTAYRAKLASIGVDALAKRFQAIVDAEHDTRLVLLCFEDLAKAGDWCHRTIFGQWWHERTGDPVRELGPTGPSTPDYEQGSLL